MWILFLFLLICKVGVGGQKAEIKLQVILTSTVSIEVSPNFINFGTILIKQATISKEHITVKNTGSCSIRIWLSQEKINDWEVGTSTVGYKKYILCGLFGTKTENYYKVGSFTLGTLDDSDVVLINPQYATGGRFAYQPDPDGYKAYNIGISEERYLWLCFHSPSGVDYVGNRKKTWRLYITGEHFWP